VYRDENSEQSVGTGGVYYYLDKILPFVEPSPEVVPNGEAKSSHPHVADAVRNHQAKSEIPEPPISVWQKNDAAWFKANPEHTHRIRRPLVGEFDDLFPDPDAVYVVVSQDAPGRWIRRPAIWREETLLGDDESLAHAIYDLVSETDGEPFTREQLTARIHEYRKPGVGPQAVLDHIARVYPPECAIACFTVPIYVGFAEQEGLISIRQNRGKAHCYRLVIEHPTVLEMFRQTRAMIMPATETLH
jgi:hypothetical protein